jgi:hypothetical protein
MSTMPVIRVPAISFAVLAALTGSMRAAVAVTPRSERVTARIVERAYARQAIAEARAARAEARVAEIAPVAPVPPPPRPATVRRMARAGVPLAGTPAPGARSAAVGPAAASAAGFSTAPSAAAPASAAASAPAVVKAVPVGDEPTGLILASPDVALPNDGTRSVLTTAEEPAAAPAQAGPTPAAGAPAELLPTPPAR